MAEAPKPGGPHGREGRGRQRSVLTKRSGDRSGRGRNVPPAAHGAPRRLRLVRRPTSLGGLCGGPTAGAASHVLAECALAQHCGPVSSSGVGEIFSRGIARHIRPELFVPGPLSRGSGGVPRPVFRPPFECARLPLSATRADSTRPRPKKKNKRRPSRGGARLPKAPPRPKARRRAKGSPARTRSTATETAPLRPVAGVDIQPARLGTRGLLGPLPSRRKRKACHWRTRPVGGGQRQRVPRPEARPSGRGRPPEVGPPDLGPACAPGATPQPRRWSRPHSGPTWRAFGKKTLRPGRHRQVYSCPPVEGPTVLVSAASFERTSFLFATASFTIRNESPPAASWSAVPLWSSTGLRQESCRAHGKASPAAPGSWLLPIGAKPVARLRAASKRPPSRKRIQGERS